MPEKDRDYIVPIEELYVYHIVTRKNMNLGQIIDFDKNQKNTLYHFFLDRERLNSKGETLSRFYTAIIQMKE
jgi:hypothetical protein